ncbi:MAG TPA: ABC transporter substrate-binding protein, partial [Anaerolineales bacterium]|nr:ABC transporter substrate-binding protein [Anaerolineales bacterium]
MKKLLSILSLLIIGMMVLTACGGGTPAATQAAETEAPVATEAATEAPTEVATEASDPNALPREETLYFNGQQWGPVVCWNPYSSNCNNAMAIAQQDNARVPMFETPYLYNMLDGKQYPLLA